MSPRRAWVIGFAALLALGMGPVASATAQRQTPAPQASEAPAAAPPAAELPREPKAIVMTRAKHA
jgi:hypothetical protein